ncbi:MAG: bifunctional sulfate adenylyltransferase/adenylylsulfate kinase [Chloroflexota bacterium]
MTATQTLETEKVELIPPYGGELVDLMVPEGELEELTLYADQLPSIQISERVRCDLELLATGAFSPLDRFMGKADHQRVLDEMRLENGSLFPMPIILPVPPEEPIYMGRDIVLRDNSNEALAIMTVEEIYEWDLAETAEKAFGTRDLRHPIVAEMHRWGKRAISGPLKVLQLPKHYDFSDRRLTPAETRSELEKFGYQNVVAFQTRNPLHRVHEELTKRASQGVDGVLLLHPVVGMTKPGDVDHYTRVRTYKALAQNYYEPDRILLSLLPLAMRMGGPREALWHAIIRRNYGANHLIVGRDHAGPGNDSNGEPFYGPYDAQELVEQHEEELGVKVVPFRMLVYLPDKGEYEEVTKVGKDEKTAAISGTQVREDYLGAGKPLPEWFTRPEVAAILSEAYPPMHRQGACVWLTGLAGAGKSTTANVLTVMLQERGRRVTLLDGDVVRSTLSRGLGFSKEDRDANIMRIAYVAGEIVRHGGLVICAAVSPYRATRNEIRNIVGRDHFVEVFVDTPLEVCQQRDPKGIYSRARRGELSDVTGIDHPYEAPRNSELTLDTVDQAVDANAKRIVEFLVERGLLQN